MKILHVCSSDYGGGAAIGAYRLHEAMRARGVDSEMLVVRKLTDDADVHELHKSQDRGQHVAAQILDRTFKALYGLDDVSIRSFNISGAVASRAINARRPDIVQLHWIGDNTLRLDDLARIDAPIVWKMPDMWPFCGAEHYVNADEPQRHRAGYDVVPPFRGEVHDLDRMIWDLKRRHFADLNLTMVSPSRFLAMESHRSALLGRYDAHVIPNPLPRRYVRRPANEAAAQAKHRAAFDLPQDRILVLFAAYVGGERRKGYHHIETLLARHLDRYLSRDEVEFVIVGGDEDRLEEIAGYRIRHLCRMANDQRYSNLLLAADVLLFPSEMDSTAMVVQECLAAGRPAIVFAVGGLVDLVHHRKSGYLATPYDVEDLARGLRWWRDEADRAAVAGYCRTRAVALNDPARTVERYVSLYETVLRDTRRGRVRTDGPGRLHDLIVENDAAAPPPRRVAIVDPSCKSVGDSSHNMGYALSFATYLRAAGCTVDILANTAADLRSDDFGLLPVFEYSAYDKLRAERDRREGARDIALRRPGSYSQRASGQLSDYIRDNGLGHRDALFVPMTDRILVDAVLRHFVGRDSVTGPSFHFGLMFEKAEFLLGNYPLAAMIRALRNTGYVDRKIFFYAETRAMTERFAQQYRISATVLRPAVLPDRFDEGATPDLARLAPFVAKTRSIVASATPAVAARPGGGTTLPPKGPDDVWIVAPGRGRRDKGWPHLRRIAEMLALRDPEERLRIVAQRPRAMDGLDAELSAAARSPRMILLDEIVPAATLDAMMRQADMFLLPYDGQVYGLRGSAFVWEAICNLKPLLVSADTALVEAIRQGNGIACADDAAFADAIAAVRSDAAGFAARCVDARDAYIRMTLDNPLLRTCRQEHLRHRPTVLVFANTPFEQPLAREVPTEGAKIVRVWLRTDEGAQIGRFHHPTEGQPHFAGYQARAQPSTGKINLPAEIVDALKGGHISEVLFHKPLTGSNALAKRLEELRFAPHLIRRF
ncbi:glycosyltransferase [Palleronia rufa]|uniref:glycosyltransferase n=1 Tax=Palleronia rufa TaxID=1530186 RepID=UPI000562E6A5|nr:glycosyltransferase [Palleronia rufa]